MQRQQFGTAGRTENCLIGVFAAYATTRGHTLVDRELHLPESWTDEPEHCHAARVPEHRRFAAKNELARTMVLRAQAGPLPVAWVAADAAYGQDSRLRRFLEDAGLSYVVAVPKSQQVHGPRIEHLIGQAPAEAWQRRSCGNGAKGPRLYDWAAARLPAVWKFDGDEPTYLLRILSRLTPARLSRPRPRLLSPVLRLAWAGLTRRRVEPRRSSGYPAGRRR